VDILPGILLNIYCVGSDRVASIRGNVYLIEPSAGSGNLTQEVNLPRIVGPLNV
jgi:hypothetical protein